MKQFKVNTTYSTRSVCDHNCIFEFKILKRTAKTVTVNIYGEEKRRGIYILNDCENFSPFGSYSMSPVIQA